MTSNNSRINVLLDLDQTLISAEAEEDYDIKKHGERAKLFSFEDMDGYYIVFERPGLQPFLDYLFANFNVSIWTAASKDYALFIIEKMILARKPERQLDYIFFSYHCDVSKRRKNGTKDLRMLWEVYGIEGYTANNTIIIDDYNEVFKTQPDNCIVAIPFEFTKEGSENDNFLEKLIPKMEKMHKHITKGGDRPAQIVNS